MLLRQLARDLHGLQPATGGDLLSHTLPLVRGQPEVLVQRGERALHIHHATRHDVDAIVRAVARDRCAVAVHDPAARRGHAQLRERSYVCGETPTTERDATLAMPTLILPAVQVNIRAGALPEPEGNGVRYLKLPIDQF